ncbi:hypothetical protein [Actinomadura decatromicini]|uniref:Uncharacterized protein n=1 Tax=Actinomadura decatromicini TaxID=2604572 RepID=A0A5D3FTW4_9ACTN|nr:hypothetical protein [Actinomadura decatromicini]TYK50555.1 hypothetical protein FXF68_08535 [Actinomadura decatromicini]
MRGPKSFEAAGELSEEVRARIESDIAPTGVNHMICAITDPGLVKSFTGRELAGVPGVDGQLRLIHEHLKPAFT